LLLDTAITGMETTQARTVEMAIHLGIHMAIRITDMATANEFYYFVHSCRFNKLISNN
jgi:hypothetical protein